MASKEVEPSGQTAARQAPKQRRLAAWVAGMATACAVIVVAPLAWDEVGEQWREFAARPRPIVASDLEIRDILRVVIEHHRHAGEPPRPPAPGEVTASRPTRLPVLREESACFADDPVPPGCSSPEFGMEDADQVTIAPTRLARELVLANHTTRRLPVNGIPESHVATSAELETIFADDGWWTDFYEKYPNTAGFIIVSLPVLSEDRRQALVYVGRYCGGHCGAGELLLLDLGSDGWRIVANETVWIS
jgi:hypothetical protein